MKATDGSTKTPAHVPIIDPYVMLMRIKIERRRRKKNVFVKIRFEDLLQLI